MTRQTPNLLPRLSRLLTQVGSNLRYARLRRRYTAETVAERAGISRKTLSRVEQGDPAVAFGIYARVLQALGLVDDVGALARDDPLGNRLQDLKLTTPKRVRRRASPNEKTG